MIAAGFIGDAVALFVRMLRGAAAPGKPEPQVLDDTDTGGIDGIAGVRE
jgi:hypothetical protein